ncbi:TPA: hypothetical protein ACP0OR_000441 [Streptococcus pyogenes]
MDKNAIRQENPELNDGLLEYGKIKTLRDDATAKKQVRDSRKSDLSILVIKRLMPDSIVTMCQAFLLLILKFVAFMWLTSKKQ